MNTVVYYPHIWPRPEWLRLAALCWDRVHLLGTELHGYSSAAPEEITELDGAMAILDTTTRVEDFLDESVADQFKRWVESREEALRQQVS